MKKTVFILAGLLVSTAASAAEPAEPKALSPKELADKIEKQLLTLDVNQHDKYLIDFYFSTFQEMFAYRELLQWAARMPEGEQRQTLLASIRAGMEAVVRDSGMGLPLAGWKGEGRPSGLLFTKGLPRYTVMPDFTKPGTLRWPESSFEKHASPEAIGQSLAAKSLFILTDRTSAGKALAPLMLQSAVQEFETLQNNLFLGKQLGRAANGAYVPEAVKLEAGKWVVLNDHSYVSSHAALLQGLTHLYALLGDPAATTYATDGRIAGKRPAEWQKEVRQTIEITFNGLLERHFDARHGSFVTDYSRQKGRGERITADDAGYVVEVLAEVAGALPAKDSLRQAALKHMQAQAGYLVGKIGDSGTVPSAFLIVKNLTSRGYVLNLGEQAQACKGLLAADQISPTPAYRKTAMSIYESMRKALWADVAGVFRSAAGQVVSGYDGRLFGMNLGLWRYLSRNPEVKDAQQHGDTLIRVVMMEGGLLQSETPVLGESPQPEPFLKNELQDFVAKVIAMKPEDQSKAVTDKVKQLTDQNKNTVPGVRFGGGRFGAAPVLVTQTGVPTPFEKPKPPEDKPADSKPKEPSSEAEK